MYIQINQEDLYELKSLQNDIKQGVFKLLNILKNLAIFLFNSLVESMSNYSEYSLQNIREKGLKQILYNRALRFFKLEEVNRNDKINRSTNKSKSKKKRVVLRAFIRLLLFPFYYIIVFLLLIKTKNIKKNKLNRYKT
jgi:hypothetical protein